MSKGFQNQLDEALKQEKLLKEAHRPSSGPWYYVYYAPNWKREVFPSSEYGALGHDVAWRNYIVPELVKHYKVQGKELQLAEAYRGMPRGRVDLSASTGEFQMAGEKPDTWYFFHGGDFPKGLVVASEESLLISAFNLTGAAMRDQVEFKETKHETMLPEHQEAIQKIIGKVPY